MTRLPSKEERDAINLNTWEQSILYSANLLLSGKNQANTRFDRDFSITIDNLTQQVSIKALIPLDYEKYYNTNLNIYKGVRNLEGETLQRTVTYNGFILPDNLSKTIVEPSEEVLNLEAFYLYSVINFKDYLIANSKDDTVVTYSQNLRRTGIDTSVSLAYKKLNYQISKDLLFSLNLDYLIVNSNSESFLITDDVLITDDFLFVDGNLEANPETSLLTDDVLITDDFLFVD